MNINTTNISQVEDIQGSVTILNSQGATSSALKGTEIHDGDIIVTGKGATAVILLNGESISLPEDTMFVKTEDDGYVKTIDSSADTTSLDVANTDENIPQDIASIIQSIEDGLDPLNDDAFSPAAGADSSLGSAVQSMGIVDRTSGDIVPGAVLASAGYSTSDDFSSNINFSDKNIRLTNDAPVASAESNSVIEDGIISGTLTAQDENVDSLIFTTTVDIEEFSLNSDGSYVFDASSYDSLAVGETQVIEVPVTVTDDQGATTVTSLTITITGTNDAPTATASTASVGEDATVTGSISAEDVDLAADAALTFTTTSEVTGLILNSDGAYSFDASSYDGLKSGETQRIEVPVTVTDDQNESVETTLTITITGTNDVPVAQAVTVSVDEDVIVNGIVSATDVDLPDDASLTFSTTSTVTGLTLNNDGSYSFDTSSYGSLSVGETLDVEVPVTITDDEGATDTTTLTITVIGTNDVPTIDTAVGSRQTENEAQAGDTVASFTASDLDGDSISFEITSGNDEGYFVINSATGVVSLTTTGAAALANDALTDTNYTLGVTASDGTTTSAESTATITFDGINDAPTIDTAEGSTQTENEAQAGDTVASFTASDLDGDTVSYAITSGNDKGYFAINSATGVVSLTATGATALANDALTDTNYTLGVTASEGTTTSAESTATITFDGINDAPIAQDNAKTINEETILTGNVIAETDSISGVDSDPDGDSLSVTQFVIDGDDTTYLAGETATIANVGTITIATTGVYTFTPVENYYGEVPDVTYTISDAHGGTDSAVLDINVDNVDDVPVASTDSFTLDEDTTYSGTVASNDTASGDGGNTWSVSTQAQNGSVVMNADGTFNYTPDENYAGTDRFTYTLTDADGSTSQAEVVLTVNSINDAPVASDDSTMTYDTGIRLDDEPTYGTMEVENEDGTWSEMTLGVTYGADTEVRFVPDTDKIAESLEFNIGSFDQSDDSPTGTFDGTASLSDWGTLNDEGEAVKTFDTDGDGDLDLSVTTSVSVGDLWAWNGANAIGFGIGNETRQGLSQGETLKVSISAEDVSINKISFTLSGLGNFFDKENSHATEVKITAFNTDGEVISTTGGYRESGEYEDTYSFITDETVSYFELTTVGSNGSYVVQNMTVSQTVSDEVTLTTLQEDGSETTTSVIFDPSDISDDGYVSMNTNFLDVDENITEGAIVSDEDTSITIDVLANDTDVDGTLDPTSLVITIQPEHGTVSVDPVTGEVTYTPNVDYNGEDSFEYTVKDNEGSVSNSATVSLTVDAVDDVPVITLTDSSIVVSEEGLENANDDTTGSSDSTNAASATGSFSVSEVDGDDVSVSLVAPTATYTSGGVDLTWSLNDEGHLIGATSDDNETIVTVSLSDVDDSGDASYTVTLSGPLDQSDGTTEDTQAIDFGIAVSDGITTTTNTLTAVVEDDFPDSVTTEATLILPVSTYSVSSIASGFSDAEFDESTLKYVSGGRVGSSEEANTDDDSYNENLSWGNSAFSYLSQSYNAAESSLNANEVGTTSNNAFGDNIVVAEITHENGLISALYADELTSTTFNVDVTLVIDGEEVTVNLSSLLSEGDTSNVSLSNGDTLTFTSQDTSSVEVEVNGISYTVSLDGFLVDGEVVDTVTTAEYDVSTDLVSDLSHSETYSVVAHVELTDSTNELYTLTGTLETDAGADGLDSVIATETSDDNGTVSINEDGTYSFIPSDGLIESVESDGSQVVEYTYTVVDGDGDSVANTLSINVEGSVENAVDDTSSTPVLTASATIAMSEYTYDESDADNINTANQDTPQNYNYNNSDSSEDGTTTLVYGNIASASWNLGGTDDYTFVANGSVGSSLNINFNGTGDNTAIFASDPTSTLSLNFKDDTDNVLILSGSQSDYSGYAITDNLLDNGDIDGSITLAATNEQLFSLNNVDTIIFLGDDSYIGDGSLVTYTMDITGTTENIDVGDTITLTTTDSDGNSVISESTIQEDGIYSASVEFSGLDQDSLSTIASTALDDGSLIASVADIDTDNSLDIEVSVDSTDTTVSVTDTDEADILIGEDGDSVLTGGNSDDILTGGDEDDTLIGGLGADILTGGDGSDTFVWTMDDLDHSVDEITDFEIDSDHIDLSNLSFTDSDGNVLDLTSLVADDALVDSNQDTLNAYLAVESDGENVTLLVSTTGELDTDEPSIGEADVSIQLDDVASVLTDNSLDLNSIYSTIILPDLNS